MIIAEGHRQISEVGFARFSARDVAKRIGYSIGTLYNVFGSYDLLILAINGHTLDLWLAYLEARLKKAKRDKLKVAISAYFEFAIQNRHAWTALYDFRLPPNEQPPEDYRLRVAAIMHLVEQEVALALGDGKKDMATSLSRSLLAIVHGHCFFTLNGTFQILGELNPLETAITRVNEAVKAISS